MTRAGIRPRQWSRLHLIALLTILFLATGVRLYLNVQRTWVGYDEANYLMIAQNAEAGLGYTQSTLTGYQPKFHLLVVFAIRALSWFGAAGIAASKALFLLGGLLSTVFTAMLGKELFGIREGLLAALYVAISPSLTSLTAASVSHSLFTPLYLLAVWLAWRALGTTSLWPAVGAGLALGAGWWARADGLVAAPCLLLLLIVGAALLGRLRQSLPGVGLFGVTFGLTYLSYAAVVSLVSDGRSAPHGPLYDFLVHPPACEASRDLSTYGSLLELALAEPQCVVSKVMENLDAVPSVFLTWTGLSVPILVLIGVALGAERRWNAQALARVSVLLFALLPLSIYLFFYLQETRYVSPYVAVALIWAARGALTLGGRLKPLGGRLGEIALPALLFLALAATTVKHIPRMESLGGKELVEAGTWIAANSNADTIVWTSQAQVALFAERPWRYPPRNWTPGSATRREESQVLLVVDERHFEAKNPEWAALLSESGDGLLPKVFETVTHSPGVIIYEVSDP